MAVYDIFKSENDIEVEDPIFAEEMAEPSISLEQKVKAHSLSRDRFVSIVCMRLFFVLLLSLNLIWIALSIIRVFTALLFFFNRNLFHKVMIKSWLSLKRSLVCGLSLFISLFSTGFGVMIACTYFVMYDKDGIEQCVPSSLQSHLKEFFKSSQA